MHLIFAMPFYKLKVLMCQSLHLGPSWASSQCTFLEIVDIMGNQVQGFVWIMCSAKLFMIDLYICLFYHVDFLIVMKPIHVLKNC